MLLNRFAKSAKPSKNLIYACSTTSKYATALNSDVIESIKSIFGKDNFTISEPIRQHHAKDESLHPPSMPDAVVFPESAEQISNLAKLCNKHRIPIIAFGAGSGLEGGVNAIKGGVTVDMTKNLNKILEANANDFDCTVEAGVTRNELNTYLRDSGCWFPIDPGADACLGGMCATSASGTNAVRYGTMRENVLNLEVVLADGRVIQTGGINCRSRKNVAGYNLTNLFVGSEGTLGIITKACLKIYPQPETVLSAVAPFLDVKSAVEATVEIMESGLPIAKIEFLDEKSIEANNKYNKMNLEVTPTLFLEFHGSKTTVDQQAEIAMDLCKQNNCKDFRWATELEERNKLWKARHHSWFAHVALYPNKKTISTDVCVPISKLPEILLETKRDIKKMKLDASIVGHVGDGNFHTFISVDTNNPEEMKKYETYVHKLIEHALSLDGTCTGEHGVGLGKKKYMIAQFGEDACNVMKSIKHTLDPNNILNPGKIL